MTDQIEPTLNGPLFDSPNEYYTHRPDVDGTKLAMGVHPVGVPFDMVEFEGNVFYEIEGKLWQMGWSGVDDKGIFVNFWKIKGEFKQD